jgi:hypothetical protein
MQINDAHIAKGELCILRNGNEIMFGSPMQQQKPDEDYQFIYWQPCAKGADQHRRQVWHGTRAQAQHVFATVMKAMARNMGKWWAVKTICMQKLYPSNNNNSNENDGSGTSPSRHNSCRSPTTSMKNLEREVNILEKLNRPNICCLHETFPPNEGGNGYCEFFL